MLSIDLVNKDMSEIEYLFETHPDGQQDCVLFPKGQLTAGRGGPIAVKIISRFSTFADLERILLVTSAIRSYNINNLDVYLYIPYLLGARSDTCFVMGGPSYLKDVIAPILNEQEYTDIVCEDPHSYKALDMIPRLSKRMKTPLMRDLSILERMVDDVSKLVVVDHHRRSGAHRALGLVTSTSPPLPLLMCPPIGKERELKYDVKDYEAYKDRDLIIVTDILDSCEREVALVTALRSAGYHGKIILYGTHGIFSYNINALLDMFDYVITTNSWQERGEMVETAKEASNLIVLDVFKTEYSMTNKEVAEHKALK